MRTDRILIHTQKNTARWIIANLTLHGITDSDMLPTFKSTFPPDKKACELERRATEVTQQSNAYQISTAVSLERVSEPHASPERKRCVRLKGKTMEGKTDVQADFVGLWVLNGLT